MSIDPIGAWGDATSLGNPYTYVGNNPGTCRNPSGLCGVYCLVGGIALVGTAAAIVLDTAVYGAQVAVTDRTWDHDEARQMYAQDLTAGVEFALLMAGEAPAAARVPGHAPIRALDVEITSPLGRLNEVLHGLDPANFRVRASYADPEAEKS